MVRSCWSMNFRSSAGTPSGPTAFTFVIAFIAVEISSSVHSISKALATGCCGNLFRDIGIKHVGFGVQQRAEELHLSL